MREMATRQELWPSRLVGWQEGSRAPLISCGAPSANPRGKPEVESKGEKGGQRIYSRRGRAVPKTYMKSQATRLEPCKSTEVIPIFLGMS